LLFSRSLHYGMQHLKGSKKRHDWIEEIKLSLNTYARDYDSSSISKVVMGGVAWKLEDIEQTISKALGLNVTIITPLQNISITQKAKIDFGRLDHPLSFSSVIALALSYQQLKINLLPFSVQTTLKKKAEYKNLINTTILIGCIILIFSVLIAKKLHDKKVILKTLNQKLSAIAPEAEDLDKKAKMTRVVIQQLEAEGSCLDIIREVHSITPSKIYLTKFIFTDGKGIVLKGSSPNMSQIFKYITIVEGSGYFANAQLRYASKRKTKGADLTDFEIHALLEQE